ncbi:ABC transporter substrate-binding protein [Methylobacterium sp. NPDC080182]|uniref:ABC transporter substrate-binding protein n=1 Tax=Methylobacterium sp. NPDC080182 TaxID=3390590 RepID=UPI003D0498E1
MRRRSFLGLAPLALIPCAWSIAHASGRRFRVCFMGLGPATAWVNQRRAIESGLSKYGYTNGQNIEIDYFWPASTKAMEKCAAQIVDSHPDIILCPGSTQVSIYRNLTTTIPIVFAYHADPVGMGHVNSLSHPGVNISGISMQMKDVLSKGISILKETSPSMKAVAFLSDQSDPMYQCLLNSTKITAEKLNLDLFPLSIENTASLSCSFDLMRGKADLGFLVPASPVANARQAEIALLATAARIPGLYVSRSNVFAGGLMSYGPKYSSMYGRSAYFIDSVIKGNNISEIPVEQVSSFDLIINESAARDIGIVIPTSVLALASDVID